MNTYFNVSSLVFELNFEIKLFTLYKLALMIIKLLGNKNLLRKHLYNTVCLLKN